MLLIVSCSTKIYKIHLMKYNPCNIIVNFAWSGVAVGAKYSISWPLIQSANIGNTESWHARFNISFEE